MPLLPWLLQLIRLCWERLSEEWQSVAISASASSEKTRARAAGVPWADIVLHILWFIPLLAMLLQLIRSTWERDPGTLCLLPDKGSAHLAVFRPEAASSITGRVWATGVSPEATPQGVHFLLFPALLPSLPRAALPRASLPAPSSKAAARSGYVA